LTGTANEEALYTDIAVDDEAVGMPFLTSGPELARALDQMEAALEILDEMEAPGDIGATLDLAIARLRQMLRRAEENASGFQTVFDQLETELSRGLGLTGTAPNPWKIPLL
jgi:hypothetical protein